VRERARNAVPSHGGKQTVKREFQPAHLTGARNCGQLVNGYDAPSGVGKKGRYGGSALTKKGQSWERNVGRIYHRTRV